MSDSIVTYQYINSPYVKKLTASDFKLSEEAKVDLVFKDCLIVLFYIQNEESMELAKIFIEASSSTNIAIFASVDLTLEKKVMQAFIDIRGDSSYPSPWLGYKGAPFIITYRNGIPQGFYNGKRDVNSLSDYATKLACKFDYHEQLHAEEGVEVTDNNDSMGDQKIVLNDKIKNSLELKSDGDGFIATPSE